MGFQQVDATMMQRYGCKTGQSLHWSTKSTVSAWRC